MEKIENGLCSHACTLHRTSDVHTQKYALVRVIGCQHDQPTLPTESKHERVTCRWIIDQYFGRPNMLPIYQPVVLGKDPMAVWCRDLVRSTWFPFESCFWFADILKQTSLCQSVMMEKGVCEAPENGELASLDGWLLQIKWLEVWVWGEPAVWRYQIFTLYVIDVPIVSDCSWHECSTVMSGTRQTYD